MGQCQLRSGESGTQTQGAAEDGSVSRSISVLVLRWWPGRGCGPGLLTPKVRAGDDSGKDAQTAPQRLLLLGGVRHRPLVSRWAPSVGPSHSAPSRGSRRQPCGRRSRRVSASSLQCERRDGRSEPPMRGCMYVPRPYMHPRARIRSPRRTASRCSAECAVARRLVDGLRANSSLSLRSTATLRVAVLAGECAQSQRGIRPLIGLRRDARPYRPAPR